MGSWGLLVTHVKMMRSDDMCEKDGLLVMCRVLARILKLPVIFERIPVRNGLKWSKIV